MALAQRQECLANQRGRDSNPSPDVLRRITMNYEQALAYLQEIDTVPCCDTQYTDAINKAKDALMDCLELGLTGEN